MAFDSGETRAILAFMDRIGIAVAVEPLGEAETFLPAMRVRGGALVVDPERLEWPGDLLHEAGHIAVTDPALRSGLDIVSADPGEEMAAIAWSWAAALEIGIHPETLFHENGYRGGARAMIDNFTAGRDVGVPMLAWFGMTAEKHRAEAEGMAPYPQMARWLR
jgi:hypothetical protein